MNTQFPAMVPTLQTQIYMNTHFPAMVPTLQTQIYMNTHFSAMVPTLQLTSGGINLVLQSQASPVNEMIISCSVFRI
jgi:hypothetical protein